jgi:hypothetical protein
VSTVVAGAAAGLAGTAALNAVTYADMAWRARPPSRTPEQSVERLAALAGMSIPGDGPARDNRLAGLAPLLGTAAGVAAGIVTAAARRSGFVSGAVPTAAFAFAAAMLVGNAPMTLLRLTDPRTWSPADWLADLVPHAAYAVAAAAVLGGADRR